MAKLFGTNGIRGVYGEQFTLEFISDITRSLASYFKKGPILIGFDGRESSVIISKIVCSSLNAGGLNCDLAGLVPTPCLQYSTKELEYNGCIMITASHNPPKYNGIKLTGKDGVEISRQDETHVEQLYFSKKWLPTTKLGATRAANNITETYLKGIMAKVNVSKIRSKKMKIVLDLGNGAQAVTAPDLCRRLNCEVITINEEIDGSFPGRGSEPTPQNLHDLSTKVIDSSADLGVAFDGDGDRSIFCDEKGQILTGDRSALLLAKFLLKNNPHSKVVTTLNSTSKIDEIALKSNSKVIRTRVGSVEVSHEMISSKALVGFEENGGFMFGKHNQVRDGAMTMALALNLLASTTNSFSKEVEGLPPSFTTKGKFECSKEEALKVIQILKSDEDRKDLTDGVKIIFSTDNWIMVRPSGTEPILRVYAEADSQNHLEVLFEKYMNKIKSILAR